MQQSATVIEIRPVQGGWQCFERLGVEPYWTGEHGKEDAIGYATARAKFGRREIRVLNVDCSIQASSRLTKAVKNYDRWSVTHRVARRSDFVP